MAFWLKPIQHLINYAIAQDPETYDNIAAFNQRRIVLTITDLSVNIEVLFEHSQIKLGQVETITSDLTITCDFNHLIQLSHDPDKLFSTEITIHGDVQFAKQLQDLLDHFDFDWEQQIAKVSGDTLAYPIAEMFRKTGSWLKSSHDSLQLNMSEYLREEAQYLPVQTQVNHYLNEVDILRADCDRLAARIERLNVGKR